MTDINVGKTSDIKPGTMTSIENEGKRYLIANVDGKYYAMDGTCSHRGGHLWEGKLDGLVVQCPRHGSRFDIRTGEVVGQPKIPLIGKARPLRVYTIKVQGEDLIITI